MIKEFEQGRKEGNKGWAVVIRGGDGQEIHPNWLKKTGIEEIGGFEIKTQNDSRILSTVGLNGLYKIHAERIEGRAKVTVTFIRADGNQQHFGSCDVDAIKVRDQIDYDGCCLDKISNPVLRRNIFEAATLAVLRSFNEKPESYSLEAKTPVDVVQAQLAARSNLNRVAPKKEHPHGRHRPDRFVKKVASGTTR